MTLQPRWPIVSRPVRVLNRLVAYVLLGLLWVWRTFVSPLYGDVCRYYPSCSAYAVEAVQVHGPWRGSWLAVRRLARCTPWAKQRGHDPVPPPVGHDRSMRERQATPPNVPSALVGQVRTTPNQGA